MSPVLFYFSKFFIGTLASSLDPTLLAYTTWGAAGGEAVGAVGEETSDDLRGRYKPRDYIALA